MPYLNVDEIDSALINLAEVYPALATLVELAEPTIEGRTCRALRIGSAPSGQRDALMLIGGQHAREWGSSDILVNLAADLLEAYDSGAGLLYGNTSYSAAQVRRLVDDLEIVVFPNVNPDGRLFSQTEDSNWRRNRNPASSGGDPDCIGVDLNRNYDFVWDFETTFSPGAGVAASSDPCDISQTFIGTAPFSEPETRNVRALLDSFPRTRWFFDVHCFSGFVLHNFADDEIQTTDSTMDFQDSSFDGARGEAGDAAYREFAPAADRDGFVALAHGMRQGIGAVRGHTYIVKSFYDMYPASGTAADYAWSRHRADPARGKIFGYTIEWGRRTADFNFQPPFEEMENVIRDVCSGILSFGLATFAGGDGTTIQLESLELNFIDIPAGATASRALIFEVDGSGGATLEALPPALVSGSGTFFLPNLTQQDPSNPPTQIAAVPPSDSSSLRQGRFWVSFTAGAAGDVAEGALTVTHLETGDQFQITLRANVVARPAVASVLVLDQSGSMQSPSGIPGKTRIDVLREAAPVFVELLADADAVGVVRFDDDFHDAMAITVAGAAGAGQGRTDALNAIASHTPNPQGHTSIGDGVFRATQLLDATTGFESKASVVFTDGFENRARFLADVADLINDRVFAIGLGTADQTDPLALDTIANSTGGFLLLTGNYGIDDRFRLSKYFLQVLVGVTNQEIIVDPDGYLRPGSSIRIPVQVTRADSELNVVLLSPAPAAFDFELETPRGARVTPAAVGTDFRRATGLAYYRAQLPVIVAGDAAHDGRWYAVLTVKRNDFRKYVDSLKKSKDSRLANVAAAHGIPWSLSAHARSTLRLAPQVTRMGIEPGATIALQAVLTESDIPVARRARVVADVRRPDNVAMRVSLDQTEPGVYAGSFVAAVNDVYQVRFHARGRTGGGHPFTREAVRTVALWKGLTSRPSSSGKPPERQPTARSGARRRRTVKRSLR